MDGIVFTGIPPCWMAALHPATPGRCHVLERIVHRTQAGARLRIGGRSSLSPKPKPGTLLKRPATGEYSKQFSRALEYKTHDPDIYVDTGTDLSMSNTDIDRVLNTCRRQEEGLSFEGVGGGLTLAVLAAQAYGGNLLSKAGRNPGAVVVMRLTRAVVTSSNPDRLMMRLGGEWTCNRRERAKKSPAPSEIEGALC